MKTKIFFVLSACLLIAAISHAQSRYTNVYPAELCKDSCHNVNPCFIEDSVHQCDIMPSYPGGFEAYKMFKNKALNYPISLYKFWGNVKLHVCVDDTGVVHDVTIAEGIHPSIDQQAVCFAYLMPRWNPVKGEGEPVKACYTLRIEFYKYKSDSPLSRNVSNSRYVTNGADDPKRTPVTAVDGSTVWVDYSAKGRRGSNPNTPIVSKGGHSSKGYYPPYDYGITVNDTAPYFPGGEHALKAFIANNIDTVGIAKGDIAFCHIVVGRDGAIRRSRVIKSSSESISHEALRLIESMPRWHAGVFLGKKGTYSAYLPIYFGQ